MNPKVIVFGIAFWYPLAGVTYQFLHYLLGLRRLGYDPYYIEDSGRWVYSPELNDLTPEAEPNIKAVAPTLEAFGFKDRWAFRGQYPGGRCFGMGEEDIDRLYRDAAAFLNITGSQELRDEHMICPLKVYVETDPVASQIKATQGDQRTLDALKSHDILFTFGENLGAPDCRVPNGGFVWNPTRQPVVMNMWSNDPSAPKSAFTTIGTWKNKGKDVTFNGEVFHWSKDLEFEKFFDLPLRSESEFELACTVDDVTKERLNRNGWRQVDSVAVSRDVDSYRRYIQGSRGEFTVAKDQNIRLRSGWFSDRSACYLAAGRPVINQDTGFGNILPTGQGLFKFQTLDDILAAIEAIEADYSANCAAALEIADEYFAADKVLQSLMSRAGI